MRRTADLPSKQCEQCQRPYRWRRKWSRCWDEVRYCSERCRREARLARRRA
ncbi:DUF2256 domain-containing protein [Halomonas sp. 1513]|nr:DUF2256 domain-containing protein [Halomonas sp. 1513]APX92110.1 DUF2256 domain-containing protein [Halomonas sp. 1513]